MGSTSSAPTGGALSVVMRADPQALLAELVEPLTRLARAVAQGRPGVEADDLVQVGLEAAWRMLPSYDPRRARPYTYVYKRVRGAMLEACFRRAAEPANDGATVEETVDDRPSAEERYLQLERQRRAMGRLSPAERELLQLCAFEGEPLRRAAAKLGLDYKCAWARLQKATKRCASR